MKKGISLVIALVIFFSCLMLKYTANGTFHANLSFIPSLADSKELTREDAQALINNLGKLDRSGTTTIWTPFYTLYGDHIAQLLAGKEVDRIKLYNAMDPVSPSQETMAILVPAGLRNENITGYGAFQMYIPKLDPSVSLTDNASTPFRSSRVDIDPIRNPKGLDDIKQKISQYEHSISSNGADVIRSISFSKTELTELLQIDGNHASYDLRVYHVAVEGRDGSLSRSAIIAAVNKADHKVISNFQLLDLGSLCPNNCDVW